MSLQFTEEDRSRFNFLVRDGRSEDTMVEVVIESGNLRILKWLKEEMGVTWMKGDMMCAAGNGQLEIVKYLENTGCPLAQSDINFAIGGGHIEVVRYMIERKYPSANAMMQAISWGRLDIMKLLYENNIVCVREAALYAANMYKDPEVVTAWINEKFP